MGRQLIFCVEAKKTCKSDYIYIKKAIDHFYVIDHAHVKISVVYMEGKGNYNSQKISGQIAKYGKQYSAGSKSNTSTVIYCFDCDDYDSNPEDKNFLEKAELYCKTHGAHFVWFAKNIENVFLRKDVSDRQKQKTAEEFARRKMVQNVVPDDLRAERYQYGRSNLFKVLDEYLDRKLT